MKYKTVWDYLLNQIKPPVSYWVIRDKVKNFEETKALVFPKKKIMDLIELTI